MFNITRVHVKILNHESSRLWPVKEASPKWNSEDTSDSMSRDPQELYFFHILRTPLAIF